MSCFSAVCPEYKFPTAAEIKKEEEAADAEREQWEKFFSEVDTNKNPKTPVQKCQEYCREVAKAEAEKARIAREKIAYALKLAGCPSRVVAPSSRKKKSSSSCPAKAKTTTSSKKSTASKSKEVLKGRG